MSNNSTRDRITELVFDWYRDVQKLPRGKTINFWNDDKVMQLVKAHTAAVLTELEGEADVYNVKSVNGELVEPNTGVMAIPLEAIQQKKQQLKSSGDSHE